jgi:ELWxxDGT repeat protein
LRLEPLEDRTLLSVAALVADVNQEQGFAEVSWLTDVNGTLYFSAYDGADTKLWKYDGNTPTNIDINPSGSSDPRYLTNVNGTLYFAADDGAGRELWKYDGNTFSKIRVYPRYPSNPSCLTNVNGTLYFSSGDLW